MVSVKEVIVVEGKYDKNTLAQAVDATILTTGGFGIFKNPEMRRWLTELAQRRGLIVLTDPDGAGFLIRNHLKSFLPPQNVKHAYIPDIRGREKRKDKASKEGKLGVEGMDAEALLQALRDAGATLSETPERAHPGVTKADFYEWGLSGQEDSAYKRRRLIKALSLPERLTANALMEALASRYDRPITKWDIEELLAAVREDPERKGE